MEWLVAMVLGGFVSVSAIYIYLELTEPSEQRKKSFRDKLKAYNKSQDHYRDGDNT